MSSDAFTALALSGVPSENLRPSRSVNVQVSPSGEDCHLLASPGSTLTPSLDVLRSVSYTLTEMNSAGLSSICQGTKGLNGSAFLAIRRTFGVLAVADAPGACVEAGAHAPISSAARTVKLTARGHRLVDANMALSSPLVKVNSLGLARSRRPPGVAVEAPLSAAVARPRSRDGYRRANTFCGVLGRFAAAIGAFAVRAPPASAAVQTVSMISRVVTYGSALAFGRRSSM